MPGTDNKHAGSKDGAEGGPGVPQRARSMGVMASWDDLARVVASGVEASSGLRPRFWRS